MGLGLGLGSGLGCELVHGSPIRSKTESTGTRPSCASKKSSSSPAWWVAVRVRLRARARAKARARARVIEPRLVVEAQHHGLTPAALGRVRVRLGLRLGLTLTQTYPSP